MATFDGSSRAADVWKISAKRGNFPSERRNVGPGPGKQLNGVRLASRH
jgi:hypothetical protein